MYQKAAVLFFVTFFLFSGAYGAKIRLLGFGDESVSSAQCEKINVKLVSESTKKKRRFLFWNLPHHKIKTVDKVIDADSNVIMKRTTVSICSMDACDNIRFRRLRLIDGEIHEFQHIGKRTSHGKIIKYDLCGEKKSEEELESLDVYVKYGFDNKN
jgi:hypothetical protein